MKHCNITISHGCRLSNYKMRTIYPLILNDFHWSENFNETLDQSNFNVETVQEEKNSQSKVIENSCDL